MQTPSRAAPHLLLALLTVLSLGAIVLSLATAPPNAEQQLRQAAKDTAGAQSFVLADAIQVVPSAGGSALRAGRQQARIVYQAPDRVQESGTVNGRPLTVLAVGAARYERSGNGPWISLGTRAGSVPAGQEAAQGVLEPIVALSRATKVVRHGDRFTFVPDQASALLGELLGSQGASLPPGSTSFGATLSGDTLKQLRITARVQGGQVILTLDIRQVDAAPALVPPAGAVAAPGR